ncbi:unnamed protein product [Sphagnum jensenii]|uniref:Uncharacterized protein n=1 Tax=Sphagnum jensenii TaxID=128206 RepID=A0ABP0W861_9BRYO
MELDWYSKKTSASHSFRSVASFTSFFGIVRQQLMLVKPLYRQLSSSVLSRSISSASAIRKGNDFQPKCMSLRRSQKWVYSQFDDRSRRKGQTCFACVLHI